MREVSRSGVADEVQVSVGSESAGQGSVLGPVSQALLEKRRRRSGEPYVVGCVPAFNEEGNIAAVVVFAQKFVDKVVVCDDGSSDLTGEIARRLGAVVVRHESNVGYGASLRSLFDKARELDADVDTLSVERLGRKTRVQRVWKPDSSLSILLIPFRLLKLKPDVVHFNCHFFSMGNKRTANLAGLCLIPLCRLLGLKVVTTFHHLGIDGQDLGELGVKQSFLNRLGISVGYFLVYKSNVVVSHVKNQVRRRNTDSIIISGDTFELPISIDKIPKADTLYAYYPHR